LLIYNVNNIIIILQIYDICVNIVLQVHWATVRRLTAKTPYLLNYLDKEAECEEAGYGWCDHHTDFFGLSVARDIAHIPRSRSVSTPPNQASSVSPPLLNRW